MIPSHCIALFLLALPLASEPLTQGERDFAMSYLHATRKQVIDQFSALSEAQWKFKAAPEVWSAAEIAEHIALSEPMIFQAASIRAMQSPAQPEKSAESRKRDQMIIQMITNRTHKAKAPEPLVPSNKFATRAAVLDAFKQARDRTIAYVRESNDDLRSHFAPHPVAAIGEMDAYQWTLLIAAHTERHLAQLKELMERPEFPKN